MTTDGRQVSTRQPDEPTKYKTVVSSPKLTRRYALTKPKTCTGEEISLPTKLQCKLVSHTTSQVRNKMARSTKLLKQNATVDNTGLLTNQTSDKCIQTRYTQCTRKTSEPKNRNATFLHICTTTVNWTILVIHGNN